MSGQRLVKSRSQVYEIYEDDDGAMLTPGDGGWFFEKKLKRWLKRDYRFVASFQASSWTRAKEAFEAIVFS